MVIAIAEETFDVVVAGGGGAGLAAAIEACTAGRTVVLLEKSASLGGSTVWSFLEESYGKLSPADNQKVEKEANRTSVRLPVGAPRLGSGGGHRGHPRADRGRTRWCFA